MPHGQKEASFKVYGNFSNMPSNVGFCGVNYCERADVHLIAKDSMPCSFYLYFFFFNEKQVFTS